MLVDIDHLLATPVYDPNRCSIGFHPLHGFYPIALYVLLCFIPKCPLDVVTTVTLFGDQFNRIMLEILSVI